MKNLNTKYIKKDLKYIWHPCSQMKYYADFCGFTESKQTKDSKDSHKSIESKSQNMQDSNNLQNLDSKTLPLIPIKRAKGVYLFDFNDKKYIDCVSSWWVNLFGHRNKYINKKIKSQLNTLEHIIMAGFTHKSIIDFSARLCGLLPRDLSKCFYADNGSSAIEVALKMSFHYFQNMQDSKKNIESKLQDSQKSIESKSQNNIDSKNLVNLDSKKSHENIESKTKKTLFLCLENSYHGETLGALSVGDVALYKETYKPLLLHAITTPVPNFYDKNMESKTQDSKKDTESTLQDSKDSHKSIESKSQNNIDSKNLQNLDSKKSHENIESKNADSTKIDSNISHKFIESNSQDSTKMNSKNSQNSTDSKNTTESNPKIKKTTTYCLSELEKILNTHGDKIAAFILEPLVQCAGNMNMYPREFVKKACEMCRARGILVIFDEIATGFGRTGAMFAFQHCDFVPDFLCLSKGISGGYLPLSVVVTRQNIYRAFYHNDIKKAFLHSHSYTGNALACAAANASLDIFKKRDILAKNAKKSAYIWATLSEILAKDSIKSKVKNVRHQGMIFAFDLNTEFLELQNSQDSKHLENLDSKKNIESKNIDSKNSHKNIESNLQNMQDSKNIDSIKIDSIKIDSKNPKIDVSPLAQHDDNTNILLNAQHDKHIESKKNYGYIFYKKALKKGLLLRPLGNTIYLMPPYIITKKQINYILKTIKKILKKL